MFISVEKHTSLFQSSDVGLLISVEIVLALILNDHLGLLLLKQSCGVLLYRAPDTNIVVTM